MSNYSLFSVLGIEIEYMLVDPVTLNVAPRSDILLEKLAGEPKNEVELGDISLSNELVMHVIELKNNGPKPPSPAIAEQFQKTIDNLQPILIEQNLQLLPTGAHPWMDPAKETCRWPHGNNDIYRQYDSIFNCKGHGWANLQSMHVNLPFANDEEFCQLHNATRLLLPLLPALAASTPFLEGKKTGFKDARLDFYGKNQALIPCISGDVIPEFIQSKKEYHDSILNPMYNAIRPYDPNGILQFEWLNSRAAIPKFEYNALEIRILDSQECVFADIAIALAINALLKHWIEKSAYFLDDPIDMPPLKEVFHGTIKQGLSFRVDDSALKAQWQIPNRLNTARSIWSFLIETVSTQLDQKSQLALEFILSKGNLSERLLSSCGESLNHSVLKNIYRQLGHCLLKNELFNPT